MKVVTYNNDQLKDKEIEETVVRVKGLIINNNNEILLGYADKTYQFPGGHLNKNEIKEEGLKREIKEETGMNINTENSKPFMLINHYTRNYRKTGKNRLNKIYYYLIKTNKKPNLEEVLKNSIHEKPINELIVKEMIDVLKEYKNIEKRYN